MVVMVTGKYKDVSFSVSEITSPWVFNVVESIESDSTKSIEGLAILEQDAKLSIRFLFFVSVEAFSFVFSLEVVGNWV